MTTLRTADQLSDMANAILTDSDEPLTKFPFDFNNRHHVLRLIEWVEITLGSIQYREDKEDAARLTALFSLLADAARETERAVIRRHVDPCDHSFFRSCEANSESLIGEARDLYVPRND